MITWHQKRSQGFDRAALGLSPGRDPQLCPLSLETQERVSESLDLVTLYLAPFCFPSLVT